MRNHSSSTNTTTEDLKTVAQDMLRMGKHWAASAQGWLDQRQWNLQGDASYDSAFDAARSAPATGYRGVGPRNYVRPDERISEELNERLADADDLDASDITMEVTDGVAILGGTVPQRRMKHRAEDIAVACSGVRDVRNQIQVDDLQQQRATGAL
ncbi:MAG: BON domain-containing protein [Pseudomonadota bacterium]|nr:BON domain-containing protein [Pseudomonadota bacterium]